jgi:hypothetical protein
LATAPARENSDTCCTRNNHAAIGVRSGSSIDGGGSPPDSDRSSHEGASGSGTDGAHARPDRAQRGHGAAAVPLGFDVAFSLVCARVGEADYVFEGLGWRVAAHRDVLIGERQAAHPLHSRVARAGASREGATNTV